MGKNIFSILSVFQGFLVAYFSVKEASTTKKIEEMKKKKRKKKLRQLFKTDKPLLNFRLTRLSPYFLGLIGKFQIDRND